MKFNLADNAVTHALSKICDMVCLNIMWLICCIPVVTIGASTTALYSVMLKMVKNEEGYIFRGFFKAFKEKQVVYCNMRQKPFYESMPMEPEVVLADLIHAFHPSLLPDYQPVYYARLTE